MPRLRVARTGSQAYRSPKGEGGRFALHLNRLGLVRDWDLVLHAPLRYRDETSVTPIAELVPGEEAQVQAQVRACEIAFRGRRQLVATLQDASGELIVRLLQFFPSQQALLEVGRQVRALGLVRGGWMGVEMIHPVLRAADLPLPEEKTLTPVYPSTAGLPQHLSLIHI